MTRNVLAAGLSAALLLFCGPSLYGHGGQYRGPTDTVPPNLGGGGDTTPPGNPGGPSTPGPGAPTTGGGRGPSTGGGPAAPGGAAGGAGRPTTGGRGFSKRGGGEGFERWEFWWEHNKEPFLNLKSRLDERAVVSESAGFLTGRGKRESAIPTNRPTAADVKTIVLPEMIQLLKEKHPDIVDSAVLAIGRMVRSDDAAVAMQPLTSTLGHDEKTAREAATLSLGVLGSKDAIDTLLHLLNDTQDGRRATNHTAGVESMVRGFAAAALGLIGASEAIEDLKSIINDDRLRAEQDLKAMSILSLGLMPKETHEDLVPFLLGLMESKNLNRIVRSQAPVSLGRLNALHGGSAAARAALSKVVSLFEADKTDNDLRRSLALCIGMLAEVGDTEAVDSMINAVQRSNDDQTRHFSIMALAEVGARDATPENHADTHNKLEQFFLRELTRPKRITHQPYGALGLAVYSRNENLQGASLRSAQKILEAFNNTNNPSYQGAMAISLGVLNYTVGQDDLWAKFDDSNDQPLKGYIAVSLGLMRATGKGEMMRALIKKKGLDSKFRLQLARALGLMSDTQAVPTLVDYLQNAETLAESSSSAQALGLIGDRNAIDPLLAIAKNPAKQELQRGFAAVALGIIAEKKDLPWNTVFSVNSNYRAKVPALSEILDIL